MVVNEILPAFYTIFVLFVSVHENLWREREFRENRPSESPTLPEGVDEFLVILATYAVRRNSV